MSTTITANPTSTSISTSTSNKRAATRPHRPLGRGAVVATVAALAGNLAVFAVGSIGEPIRVVIGSHAAPKAVGLFDIAATTVIAIVIGTVVLWVTRWRRLSDRTWVVGAAVVAVTSAVPLWRLEIDSTSKLLLSAMHLYTGACCIAAQTTLSSRA